jgi:hypothetical protein
MRIYTFEGVYEARLGCLMDAFIEDNDGAPPTIGQEDSIRAEARQYAKDFMEEWGDWQRAAHRDDRRIG